MKKSIICIIFIIFATSVFGQKNVTDLRQSHAIVLEKFLSKNSDFDFLSQRAIDDNFLKDMNKWFGKTITPYYQVGDFNNDKIQDFAMILSRKGERKENEGIDTEEYKYDYPLGIVIFNGRKNKSFYLAFKREIEAPLYCFLNFTGKKSNLYFGVFESDADTITFTPIGKGYIAE